MRLNSHRVPPAAARRAVAAGLCVLLAACQHIDVDRKADDLMNTRYLNASFNTKPIDLRAGSRCSPPRAFTVSAPPQASERKVVGSVALTRWHLAHAELARSLQRYVAEKLVESGLEVRPAGGSDLRVTVEDVVLDGGAAFTVRSRVRFTLRDAAFEAVYTGEDTSGRGENALAYTGHHVVQQLLNDPAFQRFVRCG